MYAEVNSEFLVKNSFFINLDSYYSIPLSGRFTKDQLPLKIFVIYAYFNFTRVLTSKAKIHGRHDTIEPVEVAYERWSSRIAILGGIDLDFICRKTPEEIYQRAKSMLERAEKRGCYALGSGNSIPEYVPVENYLAMISAAVGKIDLI